MSPSIAFWISSSETGRLPNRRSALRRLLTSLPAAAATSSIRPFSNNRNADLGAGHHAETVGHRAPQGDLGTCIIQPMPWAITKTVRLLDLP